MQVTDFFAYSLPNPPQVLLLAKFVTPMIKTITTAFLGLLCFVQCLANDYDDAWKAIARKEYKTARALLQKAAQNPSTSLDANLVLLLIQTYQGKESKIDGLAEAISANPNKNAYLYALWFNGALYGNYGKKEAHQLKLLQSVLSDPSYNGSIQSASRYVKAMHHVYAHEFARARQEWAAMNAIQDWQLAGPFENISGSGFNNQNGPIKTADDKTPFKGANNVSINWFTPTTLNREGWIFTQAHIPQQTAIVYAQTFVNAPADMKVTLNAGGSGSLKVWVNDGLVLSESKERATELDYYKNHCTLKKGYNRVLVQLGYTQNSGPNFIIRFTDDQGGAITGLQSTSQLQPYTPSADAATAKSQKHFAEEFFEGRIKAEPSNPLPYILLSQTFLRNDRTTEARQMMEKALQLSPENPLLKFEMIQCLSKAENRTLLLQEIEWLKESDPESYINCQIKINNLISEEKYNEADEALSRMKALYGEDESMLKQKAQILAKQEKYEDLIKLVLAAYAAYPENTEFLSMMYRYKKQASNDAKGALAVYEKYLKNNFNYSILSNLATEYKEQGMKDKYLDVLKELYSFYAHDPSFATYLATYYYEQQQYDKALDFAQQALKLAPYTGKYWLNLATIQEAQRKKEDAIASLKKAIYYDRTNYDARKKLAALEQKTELYKLVPDTDAYVIIKNAPAETKYDYSYLLDQKSTIIYEEGASEEYIHYVVKVHTQKGIDTWKEVYLNYNDDNQSLMVEKCEAVKSNGSKVPAERNDDHVVFTGLEPGDAIHVKYRVQNYSTGRLGREYWDKFTFNAFVPSVSARYTLIAPKGYTFQHTVQNTRMEPKVKEVDGFNVYTWEAVNMPAMKSEPFMPALNDIGHTLHVSTLKSWADVANWYSDISYQNTTGNFELDAFYNEIFSKGTPASNLQKARMIYDHILTNIRYSSVSFRQSGLVPQDISKIISTRLGDCKDLSTLFVALAAKAGIPAQLVLIDTRDNGSKDMVLPSMGFNHCIALARIDGKDYYIELTDNNLPFGCLPSTLYGALSLVVPSHGQKATADLKPLVAVNRTKEKLLRKVTVSINGKDQKMSMNVTRVGSLVSAWRNDYATLPEDQQMEDFEQMLSNGYKNGVKLESLSFTNLDNLKDSISITYDFVVKNEVVEAGSMKMIKVPFTDLIATLDNFSLEKREFPIEYWNYENTDEYETEVTIQLPTGQKFLEVPGNQSLSFRNSVYSLQYVTSGDKLKVIRKARMDRENISPAEYAGFKKFISDIVETESKYIVFK
jgi:tetratricopeptide (TPR) repeat protein/transglutaminase-like putative cysteine protease